jgi:hypothetical protein
MFRLRLFGKENRDLKSIESSTLFINEELDINNFTVPNAGFQDPNITCAFINDELIFVNMFHNKTLMHYHFLVDTVTFKIFNV